MSVVSRWLLGWWCCQAYSRPKYMIERNLTAIPCKQHSWDKTSMHIHTSKLKSRSLSPAQPPKSRLTLKPVNQCWSKDSIPQKNCHCSNSFELHFLLQKVGSMTTTSYDLSPTVSQACDQNQESETKSFIFSPWRKSVFVFSPGALPWFWKRYVKTSLLLYDWRLPDQFAILFQRAENPATSWISMNFIEFLSPLDYLSNHGQIASAARALLLGNARHFSHSQAKGLWMDQIKSDQTWPTMETYIFELVECKSNM